MGLTLWLVPPPHIRARLQRLMKNAPLDKDAQPPLPEFDPHITIASVDSSFTRDDLAAVLPKALTPFQVDFKSIETQPVYFRSAIVNVHLTPELNLLCATVIKNIKTELKKDVVAPNYPHLSLYYIDDKRASDRQLVVDKLKETGQIVQNNDNLEVHVKSVGVVVEGFVADEIWITRCDGPCDQWKVEKKIRLGGTVQWVTRRIISEVIRIADNFRHLGIVFCQRAASNRSNN